MARYTTAELNQRLLVLEAAFAAHVRATKAPSAAAEVALAPPPSPTQRTREANRAAFLAAKEAAIAEAKATGRTATMKEWRS